MSLKTDIVIVNEFTVPLPGGKGSRGSTPGAYVKQYMARDAAVETLAPIQRHRTDDFIVRYMARSSAVEKASVPEERTRVRTLRQQVQHVQGDGGVAFGYGSFSLSHDELHAASADLQHLFEQGHTVMKTVLSFDEDYLKRRGIIDPDFEFGQAGDYRGHIDQMKLRIAITRGLERMAQGEGGFDDLRYVGVIQVDTEHVHAHLAMVDAGPGRRVADGSQRGKLLDRHKSRLRRGMDAFLDEKQQVAQLSSAVGYEQRNVTSYIKRWAYQQIARESLPQFLLACLPEDRSQWRAGSRAQSMRKANALVTELVEEQLQREDSPLPAAMEQIQAYANTRREQEDLSPEQWRKLVRTGRERIIERSVNSVYQMLRALPPEELSVRTPMLEVMSMDYEQIAHRAGECRERLSAQLDVGQAEGGSQKDSNDDLVTFGFRLRSYASRLRHHREQARRSRDNAREWEQAWEVGAAAESSRALHDFFRFETGYHHRLVSKYQHFLPFLGDASQWYEQQEEVADYGRRLMALTALREDVSLQRMKDFDEAEAIGRKVYEQSGGGQLTRGKAGRAVLDARLASMREGYERRMVQLREELLLVGLVIRPRRAQNEDEDEEERARLSVSSTGPFERQEDGLWVPSSTAGIEVRSDWEVVVGEPYPFDEVKALDLHHLRWDFLRDIRISKRSADAFTQAARERRRLLEGAMDYFEQTDQAEMIDLLPVDDVALMLRRARDVEQDRQEDGSSLLRSGLDELRRTRRDQSSGQARSTGLDAHLAGDVCTRIDREVRSVQLEELFDRAGLEVSTAQDRERDDEVQEEGRPLDVSTRRRRRISP